MYHWKLFRSLLPIAILASLMLPSALFADTVEDTSTQTDKPAPTQTKENRRSEPKFSVGIANVYYPISSKTQNRFGRSWGNLGIALRLAKDGDAQNQLKLEADSITQSNNNGHAEIYPIVLSFSHRLSESRKCSPYIGAGAAAVLMDLKSDRDNIDTGTKCKAGAKAFAGLKFGSWGYLEANYYAMPSFKGFDLSGYGIMFGLNF